MPARDIPPHIPTVGRSVYYWPLQDDKIMEHAQPHTAVIVYVNDNGTVNLAIYNERGFPYRRCRVPLVTDRRPLSGEASFPA